MRKAFALGTVALSVLGLAATAVPAQATTGTTTVALTVVDGTLAIVTTAAAAGVNSAIVGTGRTFTAPLGLTTVILAVAALGMPVQAQSPRPVQPCKDSIGVALVDIPEARQADPRARTYVIDHVEPGARFERRLRVCNGTAAPVTVQVYAGAATIDGAAFRAVEGRQTNELSSWITVAPTQVTVPAKGEKIVPVGFAVPAGGERYAALLVEAPAVRQPSGNSVANRVGVRVYLSVGGRRASSSSTACRPHAVLTGVPS